MIQLCLEIDFTRVLRAFNDFSKNVNPDKTLRTSRRQVAMSIFCSKLKASLNANGLGDVVDMSGRLNEVKERTKEAIS